MRGLRKGWSFALGWLVLAPLAALAQAGGDVRLNQVQVLGTHNSYKQAVDPRVMAEVAPQIDRLFQGMLVRMGPGQRALFKEEHPAEGLSFEEGLAYAHPPLAEQLDAGLRSLEIDVHADPKGGLYANPAAYALLRARGEKDLLPHDNRGLDQPGFKVMHIPDIDFRSHCPTFRACLGDLRRWSDQHPGHLPVFILLEVKTSGVPILPGSAQVPTFDAATFDALDADILGALGRQKLVVPDDLRGSHATLREAALAQNWPRLTDARGKFVFLMITAVNREVTDHYLTGHPSLRGRVAFLRAEPEADHAAFLLIDNALVRESEIQERVRQGYLVRSRSDIETLEARTNDLRRAQAAFRSGAQIVSTDFYKAGNAFGTPYAVSLPGGGASRCNPVNAPKGCVPAQEAPAAPPGAAWPDRRYVALASPSPVQDRNFYLFTAIDSLPSAREALLKSAALQALAETRLARLDKACSPAPACQIEALLWTGADMAAVGSELRRLQTTPAFQPLVSAHMRPSGRFQRHASLSDADLLAQAWTDAAQAMNRILRVYALGQAPRYADIDATSLDVSGERFKLLWPEVLKVLRSRGDSRAVHELPLRVALTLLHLDGREDAAHFPQLDQAENAPAARHAATVDWSAFRYSAILVLGDGPTVYGQQVGQAGKLRLMHAARLYAEGLAPFLIVSGGNVHPARTTLNEAEQMKVLLMTRYGVPEHAIVMEPHARHTTTNFRNAARLMFRYGFPLGKEALVSTSSPHSSYCESDKFRQRLMDELGALPMTLGERVSEFDLEFKPLPVSLHLEALDPLDP